MIMLLDSRMTVPGDAKCEAERRARAEVLEKGPSRTPDELVAYEPFLSYLGMRIVEARPGHAILRLEIAEHLTNHVHGIHAGAQHTLGESTAAMVAISLVLDQLERVNVLTQSATISYQRPARGSLQAEGSITDEAREAIQTALARGERASCEVPATITDDEGREVTTLRVSCVLLAR
jgi:uncharacterized protein (TIGR00369 family)